MMLLVGKIWCGRNVTYKMKGGRPLEDGSHALLVLGGTQREEQPLLSEMILGSEDKNETIMEDIAIVGMGDDVLLKAIVDSTKETGIGHDSASLSKVHGKAFYASMVDKNYSKDGGSFSRFDYGDEVFVLDEDYVIDRSGPFPSIKFLEHVHEQIDSNMWDIVIVRLLGSRFVALEVTKDTTSDISKDGNGAHIRSEAFVDVPITDVLLRGKIMKPRYSSGRLNENNSGFYLRKAGENRVQTQPKTSDWSRDLSLKLGVLKPSVISKHSLANGLPRLDDTENGDVLIDKGSYPVDKQ
ncbi:hypothetical protein V6N11_037743 [Hibiscus sabdariffa]|uniref:Uncharacterized protein n=2 Tax=Hibiscus sabdariffa TaxID=183260 RepID=A0ABR2ALP9_9ROSI